MKIIHMENHCAIIHAVILFLLTKVVFSVTI